MYTRISPQALLLHLPYLGWPTFGVPPFLGPSRPDLGGQAARWIWRSRRSSFASDPAGGPLEIDGQRRSMRKTMGKPWENGGLMGFHGIY